MWTKLANATQTIEFLKEDGTSLGKTAALALDLSKITIAGAVTPPPAGDDVITGTVSDSTLSVTDSQVKDVVAGQLEGDTIDEVSITVTGASADAVEVPLNSDTLTALEEVTVPVTIDTPEGGVSLPSKTLVEQTGKDFHVPMPS